LLLLLFAEIFLWDDKQTKQQVDKMGQGQGNTTASLQNSKLTKWSVSKTASW